MLTFRYACRRCGHSIAREPDGWVHVAVDGVVLHQRCRAASRLRVGAADDRLPKTATAQPLSALVPTQARPVPGGRQRAAAT